MTTAAPEGIQEVVGGKGKREVHYKWIALSNTTLGVLMATINSSIMLIALPDIFRGIHMNPLVPSNTSYLLWLLMGYMVVTAVLVVSFGRIGDMYGRVKMYNLGFVVFTVFSILLSVTWMNGSSGALWMIVMRILQGVGGAFLMANSTAILTDAFPDNQRGLALGINNVAGIAGSFIGLILGGLLGPVDWHLVFVVSVPFGLFGTVWAYLMLRDSGVRIPSRIDWWGNLTFAVGLVALLAGITYGIMPYRSHTMGWSNPWVITAMAGGVAVLVLFAVIEAKVADPMFRLPLFRIRAFLAGNFASLLASLGRGGMMFILIIWLQGIWLPLHGYSFVSTPLWAGIYMLPMTAGFLIAGPVSGILSDHYGARPFATGGMVVAAVSFLLLTFLPIDFSYIWFALLLLVNGLAMGLFASPNRAGIMNSLPPRHRGAGAGMVSTFQLSAMVLSIGIFFTLIITGLAAHLPAEMYAGLHREGVHVKVAERIAHLPPTATVFSAFLGYNPVKSLLGPAIHTLTPARAAYLTGRSFFPRLISHAFGDGLREAFFFGMAACVVAAAASWLRGGKYHYVEGAELKGSSELSGAGLDVPPVAVPPVAAVGAAAGTAGTSPEAVVVTSPGTATADAGVAALSGTVRDSHGNPLEHAVVTILDSRGSQADRMPVDPGGHFTAAGLAPGAYTALVTAPGHRPEAGAVILPADGATVDFTVTRAATMTGTVRQAGTGTPVDSSTVTVTDAAARTGREA